MTKHYCRNGLLVSEAEARDIDAKKTSQPMTTKVEEPTKYETETVAALRTANQQMASALHSYSGKFMTISQDYIVLEAENKALHARIDELTNELASLRGTTTTEPPPATEPNPTTDNGNETELHS